MTGRQLVAMAVAVVTVAASMAMHLVAGSRLGSADYGRFAAILALAQLVAPLAALGAGQVGPSVVTRLVARGDTAATVAYRRITDTQTLALASMAGVGVLVAQAGWAPMTVVAPAAICVPAIALRRLRYSHLNGLHETATATALQELLPSLTVALVLLALSPVGLGVAFAAVLATSLASILAMSALWHHRLVHPIDRQPAVGVEAAGRPGTGPVPGDGDSGAEPVSLPISFRGLLPSSLPALAARVGDAVLERSDLLLVGLLLASDDLGVYSAATKLALVVQLGVSIVSQVYSPGFALLDHTGRLDELRRSYRTAQLVGVVGSVAGLVVLAVARRPAAALLGTGFDGLGAIMITAAAGQVVNAVTGPTSAFLYMTGRGSAAARASIPAAAAMLAAGVPLTLACGPRGGGGAAATAALVRNLAQYLVVRRAWSGA